MSEIEHFEKVIEMLLNIILNKDLGDALFNEAIQYFEILDNINSTYEDKHRASILAERLLSNTKDFPDIARNTKTMRR